MNNAIQHKLVLFQEVEKVCFAHHEVWVNTPGIASLLSRLAVKVTQLELSFGTNATEINWDCQTLIFEIETELLNRLDRLILKFQLHVSCFFLNYQTVRYLA